MQKILAGDLAGALGRDQVGGGLALALGLGFVDGGLPGRLGGGGGPAAGVGEVFAHAATVEECGDRQHQAGDRGGEREPHGQSPAGLVVCPPALGAVSDTTSK
jgi:hypothetical protein